MSDSLTEIQIKKRTIEINILTHLQNYKRTLIASNEIGANVLRELSVHREKLDEVDGDLEMMKADLDESDEYFASISSFLGGLKSFFLHHEEKQKRKSSESEDDEKDNPDPTLKRGDQDSDKEESPVDPNDFQSVVNGEMREIKKLLKTLHRAAEEMNSELNDEDEKIQQARAECEKLDDQVEKETKECKVLLEGN